MIVFCFSKDSKTKENGDLIPQVHTNFAQELTQSTANAQRVEIMQPITHLERENELVFFFKPEVFLPGAKTLEMVQFALDKFAAYGIEISGAVIFPGVELERLAIMDAHYGFINTMSRRASTEIAAEDAAHIRKAVGADAHAPILGGHEMLNRFRGLSPHSLDKLWATKPSVKIRSGLYVQLYDIESTSVIMVNGFHPAQLKHFTASERKIAVLLLHSNLPWRFLRGRVLGDTFPEKALPGTMRRNYFDRCTQYGLEQVSIANNCVHMSAGPFEAAFEIKNFLGRLEGQGHLLQESNVGRRVNKTGEALSTILKNPETLLNEKPTTLFDATEEIDTTGAIEVFYRLYGTDRVTAVIG
jgi:hypothetical protein